MQESKTTFVLGQMEPAAGYKYTVNEAGVIHHVSNRNKTANWLCKIFGHKWLMEGWIGSAFDIAEIRQENFCKRCGCDDNR